MADNLISTRLLDNMRRFYQAFPIQDALRLELTCTHHRILLRADKSSLSKHWNGNCVSCNYNSIMMMNPKHRT